jgi:RNA polymerase primary sigma factor
MTRAVLESESKSGFLRADTHFQKSKVVDDRGLLDSPADEGSSGSDCDLVHRRRRAARIFKQSIDFVDSPSFRKASAVREILGPEPRPRLAEEDRTGASARKAPAGTPPYLAGLYEVPLLTQHEEYFLFRKMNFLKFRADRLRRQIDRKCPQPKLLDEVEQSLAEALAVRNRIVGANLRLVVSIAKTLVDGANDFEDIVSEGNLPLIRAAEIFDFERGTRFSTYATWAVRNGLYRATSRNRQHRQRFSLHNEAAFESAADDRSSALALENYHRGLRKSVETLLDRLEDQRDRVIVKARFGLDEQQNPQKFREIAEKLQLSTERVRQLLTRSLHRLRDDAEPDLDAPDAR